jgi:hypothetical protein
MLVYKKVKKEYAWYTNIGNERCLTYAQDIIQLTYEFHQLLAARWQLVETFDLRQWLDMRDRLFVYRRS